MHVPLQIVFENIPHSEAMANQIRQRVRRMESVHPRLTRCQVAVSQPNRRRNGEKPRSVTVILHMADDELVVTQAGTDDVHRLLQTAFELARRKLSERARDGDGSAWRADPDAGTRSASAQ